MSASIIRKTAARSRPTLLRNGRLGRERVGLEDVDPEADDDRQRHQFHADGDDVPDRPFRMNDVWVSTPNGTVTKAISVTR